MCINYDGIFSIRLNDIHTYIFNNESPLSDIRFIEYGYVGNYYREELEGRESKVRVREIKNTFKYDCTRVNEEGVYIFVCLGA